VRRIPTRRASALQAGLAVAVALALAFAGCGGGDGNGGDETSEGAPALPRPLAEQLAAQSEAVADALEAGDTEAAKAAAEQLRNDVVAAVNEGRVPPELQEGLTGAVNVLAEDVAAMAPPPQPPPTTTGETTDEEEDDD
jgi:hypothetical protein